MQDWERKINVFLGKAHFGGLPSTWHKPRVYLQPSLLTALE
jgi:hypothetical protein